MNGGARVAEVLTAHGVGHLFTLCGGHIAPILVESKRRGVRVVDVRHEANAVFAADAVARLTGVPGVAAVTAGPGVTNTITAIKNAQLAQSPVVVLGGATATMLRGRGALQDIDQMALVEPHVKWAARPNNLRDVVPAVEKAFRIARTGVPGPVFVELAVDLLYEPDLVRSWYRDKTDKPDKNLIEQAMGLYIRGHLTYLFAGAGSPAIREPAPVAPEMPRDEDIGDAARVLGGARKPVMVIGSQAMMHPRRVGELVSAVERIGAPVYLSGMARGLLGADHPLQMRHQRRKALRGADVVVLAGVPCDFRLDYGAHVARAKVIGVNLSKRDLTKNRRPTVGIEADPHEVLSAIARRLPEVPAERAEWMAELRGRDAEREREIDGMAAGGESEAAGQGERGPGESRGGKGNGEGSGHAAPGETGGGINPLALCRAIDRALSDDSVLVGDGGDFVATASYTIRPRGPYSWLDPGVFGTLGVGAGFAMGARLVRPGADVWLLYGDGAAGFSLIELDTFARHGLPVIAVIGNDGGWTQIEREQVPILGDDVGCRLARTDYHVIARGCGAEGIVIREPGEVEDALARAVALSRAGRPVVVNALIGRTDFRKGSISM